MAKSASAQSQREQNLLKIRSKSKETVIVYRLGGGGLEGFWGSQGSGDGWGKQSSQTEYIEGTKEK